MLPLMAQFTTRVELHRATGEDYSSLHSAMEYQGFSRTIRSDDGIIYILPTAKYDRTGDNLSIQIRDSHFYKCWAGCTKVEIRAALGRPIRMKQAA